MDRAPDCAVAACLSLFTAKWAPLVLWKLGARRMRFGELRRAIPRASKKMLTQRLRELEGDGLVRRSVGDGGGSEVHYELTDLGRSLRPLLDLSATWALRHHPAFGGG